MSAPDEGDGGGTYTPITYSVLAGENNGSSEGEDVSKMFDGQYATKWGCSTNPDLTQYAIFKTSRPIAPTYYCCVTGNDSGTSLGRNWKDYSIYGINAENPAQVTRDMEGWVLLDKRENVGPDVLPNKNFFEVYLPFNQGVTTEFEYFKIEIGSIQAGTGYMQMSEFFLGDQTTFQYFRQSRYEEYLGKIDATKPLQKSILAEMKATAEKVKNANDLTELDSESKNFLSLQEALASSVVAYENYMSIVAQLRNHYDNHTCISGEGRTVVGNYLNSNEGPSSTFPNGTYAYVLENGLLDNDGIKNEGIFANMLMEKYASDLTDGAVDVTYQALNGTLGFGTAEDYGSLVDGLDDTKWCSDKGDYFIVFKASEAIVPTYYRLFTGNDTGNYSDRNWNSWKVYGMNCSSDEEATRNAEGWVLLDEKNNVTNEQLPDADLTACYLYMSNPSNTPYQYFKIEVSDPSAVMQMGEFSFGNGANFILTRQEYFAKFSDMDFTQTICHKGYVEEFNATLNAMKTTASIIELGKMYDKLTSLVSQISASVDNYKAYEAKVAELRDALSSMDGYTRNLMEKYCDENIAPGAEYARGTYPYIIENRQLDNDELNTEITYLANIIKAAKEGGFVFLSGSTNTWDDGKVNQLIDKDMTTKFGGPLDYPYSYIIFRTQEATSPLFYKLTTGNDTGNGYGGRNWKNWQIYGANFDNDQLATTDAEGWVLIENRENIGPDRLPAENFYTAPFGFSEGIAQPYKYYMVKINAAYSGSDIQMTEFEFGTQIEFDEYLNEYCSIVDKFDADVLAEAELLAKYQETVEALRNSQNMEDLYNNFANAKKLQEQITTSASAYALYQKAAEDAINYVEGTKLDESEALDNLMSYLYDDVEPDPATFPNGSYNLIIDARALNAEAMTAETAFLTSLQANAIAAGYPAGAEVTMLVKNPEFTDGSNYWDGDASGIAIKRSTANGRVGIEAWNRTFDATQTLTGLKNGIYVLSMTAGSRPGFIKELDIRNLNYSASISTNENMVFIPGVFESYISTDEAIDGENCHISGETIDFAVTNEEGDTIGYAMQGQESVANAANGGRAITTIVANVTDGTLKVGIQNPGLGMGSQWVGWSNMRLIYLGEMTEADAALDETLAGQAARANAILNYEFAISEDYKAYPNISQALKDELTAEIAEVETATTPEAKYALVQKFSKTLADTYTCKMAYIDLLNQTEATANAAFDMSDQISKEMLDEVVAAQSWAWTGYEEGSISAEDAQKMEMLKSTQFYNTYMKGVQTLITSASQLSSNASDIEEGQHIEYLIDGDPATFWHTDWHGKCPDAYHYLQVALNSEFTGDISLKMTRRDTNNNNHPTKMLVSGSQDGVEFTDITTLDLPFEGVGTNVSASFRAEGVNYLRFTPTDCCTGFNTFWHCAEFQLYGKNEGLVADLFDVVFNEDGTATDISATNNTIYSSGTPSIVYLDEVGRNVLDRSREGWSSVPSNDFYFPMNEMLWGKLSDGFSMECYVRPEWTGDNSSWISLFGFEQGGGTGMITDGGKWCMEAHVGGSYKGAYGTVPVNNEWVHLLGVWDKTSGQLYLYQNGQLAQITPAVGDLKKPNVDVENFHLGCDVTTDGSGDSAFQGQIAILRLYDNALTGDEAAKLYSKATSTDISDIKQSAPVFKGIYNLGGQRLYKVQKGLNIVDGQKILIK